jgi:peptidylprolyl isomerase
MTKISESEAVSVGIALIIVAVVFFGVFGNPFFKMNKAEKPATSTTPVTVADPTKNRDQAAQDLRGATDEYGKVTKLAIRDEKVGEGTPVVAGDTLTLNYVGKLIDGTEFDSSIKSGKPFTFTVGKGDVIKGWDQGLIGMKKGGQRTLIIPADMAYGDRGAGGVIPPGATLLFSIALLDIKS